MLTSAGVPPDMSAFLADYAKFVILPWVTGFLILTRCRYAERRRGRVFKGSSYI